MNRGCLFCLARVLYTLLILAVMAVGGYWYYRAYPSWRGPLFVCLGVLLLIVLVCFLRWSRKEEKKGMEKRIYHSVEEAEEALDRGEAVHIALTPYRIDPALVQLAWDIQAKERLEEWKRLENLSDQGC